MAAVRGPPGLLALLLPLLALLLPLLLPAGGSRPGSADRCSWRGRWVRTAGPGGRGHREPAPGTGDRGAAATRGAGCGAAVPGGFTAVTGREMDHKCSQYSQILQPFPLCFVAFLLFF